MLNNWEKVKVYAKLSLICLVMLAVLIFILSNTQGIGINFLGWTIVETWVWLLIVLAGFLGVIVFLITRRIKSVVRQFRQIRGPKKAPVPDFQTAGKNSP